MVGGGAHDQQKKTARMANTNEKPKQNHSESDSEKEKTKFLKFIVIKSLEETLLAT